MALDVKLPRLMWLQHLFFKLRRVVEYNHVVGLAMSQQLMSEESDDLRLARATRVVLAFHAHGAVSELSCNATREVLPCHNQNCRTPCEWER